MGHYRRDHIPSVESYSHWNEDAHAMWYMENKYDMDHGDEYIEDEYDDWDFEDDSDDDSSFDPDSGIGEISWADEEYYHGEHE